MTQKINPRAFVTDFLSGANTMSLSSLAGGRGARPIHLGQPVNTKDIALLTSGGLSHLPRAYGSHRECLPSRLRGLGDMGLAGQVLAHPGWAHGHSGTCFPALSFLLERLD